MCLIAIMHTVITNMLTSIQMQYFIITTIVSGSLINVDISFERETMSCIKKDKAPTSFVRKLKGHFLVVEVEVF